MKGRFIQVREWSRINLPKEFSSPKYLNLILAKGETKIGSAFSIRRGALYSQDLVGTIDAGPVQIQILPKLHTDSSLEDDSHLLLDLIIRFALPKGAAITTSKNMLSSRPIIEPILLYIVTHLQQIVLGGAPKRYGQVEEETTTLRGRVDIGKIARRQPGRDHHMPVRHYPLNYNNPISRTLRAVASEIASLTKVGHTQAMAKRLRDAFLFADRVRLSQDYVNSICLSRLENRWLPVLTYGSLFASQRSFDHTKFGDHQGLGLLFKLHDLFESLVRSCISEACIGKELKMRTSKSGGRLLHHPLHETEHYEIQPDVIIDDREHFTPVIVADVKWKRLDVKRADLGIAHADLYQILVYMKRLGVNHGLLIFPMVESSGDLLAIQKFIAPHFGEQLSVMQISVPDMLSADPNSRKRVSEALYAALHSL